MKTFQRILLIIAAIYGIIFIFVSASDAQRAYFGGRTSRIIFIFEICTPILAYFGYFFWKRGKKAQVILGMWLYAAIIFAFLGWFVHPAQIYERAVDRHSDWEISKLYSEESMRQSKSAEEPGLYLRRFQEELRARNLELRAAEIRYHGEPKFFRSTFFTWSLWFFAIVCLVGGGSNLLNKGI